MVIIINTNTKVCFIITVVISNRDERINDTAKITNDDKFAFTMRPCGFNVGQTTLPV